MRHKYSKEDFVPYEALRRQHVEDVKYVLDNMLESRSFLYKKLFWAKMWLLREFVNIKWIIYDRKKFVN